MCSYVYTKGELSGGLWELTKPAVNARRAVFTRQSVQSVAKGCLEGSPRRAGCRGRKDRLKEDNLPGYPRGLALDKCPGLMLYWGCEEGHIALLQLFSIPFPLR